MGNLIWGSKWTEVCFQFVKLLVKITNFSHLKIVNESSNETTTYFQMDTCEKTIVVLPPTDVSLDY